MRRLTWLTYSAGIALAMLVCGIAAAAPLSPLVGTWRHLKMVQTADGKIVRVHQSHGESSIEYKADGSWTMVSPGNQNSGTYRLLDGGLIESTTLQSNLPKQVGWRSFKRFRVDGAILELVTHYDAAAMQVFPLGADGTRPREMSVTSTFERSDAGAAQ